MRDFGEFPSLSLECSSLVAAIRFFCSLYQKKKASSNINELRYAIFTKNNVSGVRLPPTLSRRVNYQSFIWESACVPVLDLPSPIRNRLQVEGLKFCEEFILNSSAPDAIVELTRHKWKKGCKTNSSYENTNHYKLYKSDGEKNL